jgi:hypothetical protein
MRTEHEHRLVGSAVNDQDSFIPVEGARSGPPWSDRTDGVTRSEQKKGGPNMLELMHQINRLLLNLFKLAREVRVLASEFFNLMVARQARYFR